MSALQISEFLELTAKYIATGSLLSVLVADSPYTREAIDETINNMTDRLVKLGKFGMTDEDFIEAMLNASYKMAEQYLKGIR